jgi:hypothetical protein
MTKIIMRETLRIKRTLFKAGGSMERLSQYVSELIELLLLGIIFLIALPFRILYNLGGRIASR